MQLLTLMRNGCCLALSSALLFPEQPSQAAQQGPPPTFKSEATAVVVDVIVADRKGKPVTGLPKEAFKVYEDGVEQSINNFSQPDGNAQQDTATKAPTTESTPGPAPLRAAAKGPSQFLTVVLDLADNQPSNLKLASEAVVRYLRKTKTADTAVAIYYISSGLHLALPFTENLQNAETALDQISRQVARGSLTHSDRRAIQDQIDDLFARVNPESGYGAQSGGIAGTASGSARAGPADPMIAAYRREIESLRSYLSTMNTFQARSIFVALRALAMSYVDIPGRKNVVLFSEGFAFSTDSRNELDAVTEAANQANVSFYVIDPAGLDTRLGLTNRAGGTRAAQMTEIAEEGIGQRGGESKFDRMRAISTEVETHSQLGILADATGGLLIKNTNDLVPAFEKVIEDSRNFYTLVYSPTNKAKEGSFRKIKVSLPGNDGYKLRYRLGYWALPRGPGYAMTPMQAHVLSTVRRVELKSEFTPVVTANVALAPDGKYYAPLSVAVPVKYLPSAKDAAAGKSLAVIAFAFDRNNNLISSYEKHWEVARPEEVDDQTIVTMQGQMALPSPQSLRVQTIVQLPNGTWAIGEDKAEFSAQTENAAALGGLFLTSKVEQATCDDPSEALCVQTIRLLQPAALDFPRASSLIAYIAADGLALDPQSKQPRVGAEFKIKAGEKVLGSVPTQNVNALPGPNASSARFVARLNLSALPTGNYTLEATIHDLARKTSTTQTTTFHLE